MAAWGEGGPLLGLSFSQVRPSRAGSALRTPRGAGRGEGLQGASRDGAPLAGPWEASLAADAALGFPGSRWATGWGHLWKEGAEPGCAKAGASPGRRGDAE